METYLSDADDMVVVITADGGLNHGTATQIYDVVQKSIECGMRGVIVDCSRLPAPMRATASAPASSAA